MPPRSPRRTRFSFSFLAAATAGLAAGCYGTDEYINEGSLCLLQSPETGVITVRVSVGDYSSGCSRLESSHCAVSREGETLTVTSRIRVGVGGQCNDDSRPYESNCSLSDAPPGEYTLRHGNFETTLVLPLPDGAWSNDTRKFRVCGLAQ